MNVKDQFIIIYFLETFQTTYVFALKLSSGYNLMKIVSAYIFSSLKPKCTLFEIKENKNVKCVIWPKLSKKNWNGNKYINILN